MNSETDPAKLWKQVEKQSTTAEVALASLYLDGIVVPQNCAQAQVLSIGSISKAGVRMLEDSLLCLHTRNDATDAVQSDQSAKAAV